MARLTDRPDMTLDVYHGRKTIQQQQYNNKTYSVLAVDNNTFLNIFASNLCTSGKPIKLILVFNHVISSIGVFSYRPRSIAKSWEESLNFLRAV